MTKPERKTDPLLVKVIEAAKLLAISPRTLWKMTANREIPHVRIGRSVRYSLSDLADYIGQQTTLAA